MAAEIATRAGLSEEEIHHTIVDGIYHDMHEIKIGDIPTPAKENGLVSVKDGLKIKYHSANTEECVKWADLIQAWWFVSQWGTGRHAEEVAKNCLERLMLRLNQYDIPKFFFKTEDPIGLAAWEIFHELKDSRHEI